MFQVCIFCAKKCDVGAPAVISPWIRELGIDKRTSHYLKCEDCNLGFFTYRYNTEEMANIYSDYRGSRYFKIRSVWEPWYSNAYNSNHDSLDWVQSRKLAITKFITPRLVNPALRVADIGGDTGQFIPDFATLKYVVDPSGKNAAAGVTCISEMKDLPDVDLIIYAHVLEHVADPVAEIKALMSKVNQIYVEVPFGVSLSNVALE